MILKSQNIKLPGKFMDLSVLLESLDHLIRKELCEGLKN